MATTSITKSEEIIRESERANRHDYELRAQARQWDRVDWNFAQSLRDQANRNWAIYSRTGTYPA
jgi:hypothetical protein